MAVHLCVQILLPLLMTHLPSIHGVNQDLLSVACSDYAMEREGRYICTEDGIRCLAGWTDLNSWCQEPVCGPQCKKPNGICHAPDQCLCSIGYYGDECEYCTPLPGCMNGNCSKPFECNCREGWTGQLCDQPVCGKDCHHGYCTGPDGTCHCHHGWTGPNCDECLPLPGCDAEHGYCTEPMDCKCRPTWTGTFCHMPSCPEKCETHGNGHCQDGRCQCKIGWHGEDCSSCAPYPGCEHGSCSNPWECNCDHGWTGHLCNVSKEYVKSTTENFLNPTATPNHATTRRIISTENPLEELSARASSPRINLATPNLSSSRFNDDPIKSSKSFKDIIADRYKNTTAFRHKNTTADRYKNTTADRYKDTTEDTTDRYQDTTEDTTEMFNETQHNFEKEASGMEEQLQMTTSDQMRNWKSFDQMSNVERRRNKNKKSKR